MYIWPVIAKQLVISGQSLGLLVRERMILYICWDEPLTKISLNTVIHSIKS